MQGPWSDGVPERWSIRPLWSEFRRGKTLGDGSEELLSVYRDYGVIPKSSREDNFNKASEDLSKYQRVSVGDLVVNKMKAWQGSLGISDYDGIVSPAYFVYRAIGRIERRFAHYLLRSKEYADHMAAISSGIRPNQWDLDPAQFAVTPLLVPPPAEQRAIADYLDRETAQIDAFIAKNEELIALLTERRAATVARSVLRGIDPKAALRSSGVSWLGDVPTHWRVSRLSRWFSVTLGKMLDESKFASTVGEVLPYVRASNIKPEHLDLTDVKSMPFTRFEQKKLSLRAGDLVVVEGGSVGVNAPIEGDMPRWGFQKTVNRVRSLRGDLTRFLGYQLDVIREAGVLNMIANVSTIQHLTAEKLERLVIAMPPRSEQIVIVDHVRRATTDIDKTVQGARRAIDLARERRVALISAAVTGKIEVGVAA